MRAATRITAILLVVASYGCDGDPPAPVDGGPVVDAGRTDAGPRFTPPDPPAPPRLGPCPDGWREVVAEGLARCDPYPESGRSDCGPGEAHFPGEAGCAPIGAPCPSGEWPDPLPEGGARVFVRSGATGGDGSQTAPFGTLAEALAATPDIVVLARGTYLEHVALTPPIRITGACAAETIIESDSLPRAPIEVAGTGDVTVEGVSLVAAGASALTVRESRLVVRGVELHAPNGDGVFANAGAELVAEGLVATDIERQAISTGNDATVSLDRALIGSRDADVATISVFGSTLTGTDVALVRRPNAPSALGYLIHATSGARLVLERVAGEGVGPFSVLTDGSEVVLRDALFRGDPAAPEAAPSGLFAYGGATVELERIVIDRGMARPLLIGEPDVTLGLTDVIIVDVFGAGADQSFGRGVDVESGAAARLRRVWIDGATESAILVSGPGATATAEDLTVRRTRSDASGFFGRGLMAQLGAQVNGARIEIVEAREIALMASEPGTAVTLTDVAIADTLPRACHAATCRGFGAGLGAGSYGEATLTIERLRVSRSALSGVQIATDGRMVLSDGEVFDNPIGANVQVPGYDLSTLMHRMVWRNNGVNLDAAELPIPEPRR